MIIGAVSKLAREVKIGDTVMHRNPSFNYTVEDIVPTRIGMLMFQHNDGTASSAYWPNEVVPVKEVKVRRKRKASKA